MALLNDRKILDFEKKAGGKGHVLIEPLLGEKELAGQCGLYARVTLEPGCSLGYHEHHGESETYYILTGQGTYSDNGKNILVKAGDVTFCPDGEGHGLENTAKAGNLIFMGLIIKNKS
jgi:quercetin dioxygenase-like cupin family protein